MLRILLDIERVLRAAMRVIMGNKYEGYEEALKFMKLKHSYNLIPDG